MTIGKNEVQYSAGNLLDQDMLTHGRDAIHVAVLAATVDEPRLHPGQAVKVVRDKGGEWVITLGTQGDTSAPIGIIDPFLPHVVYPRDIVWVWLMPNTITSLRHVWTHPDFLDDAPELKEGDFPECVTVMANSYGVTVDNLMKAADDVVSGLSELSVHRMLNHGIDYPPPNVVRAFWDYYGEVHGKPVSDEDREQLLFSCSC